MPTATETQTEAEQATVVFRSRDPEQVLTIFAAPSISNGRGGTKVQTFDEYIADQKRKNAERETVAEKPQPIDDMPWKVIFKNGAYETSDPRVIEWLRGHDKFNVFDAPSGFFEEPPAAEDPGAAMAALVKRMTPILADPSLEESITALHELLDEEKAGKNRPAIVEAVETAIEAKLEPSEPEDAAEPGNGVHGEPDGSDGTA